MTRIALHFLVGLTAAFLGLFLAELESGHVHAWQAHAAHQLLLAVPLSLLVALAFRPKDPRELVGAAVWGGVGAVGGMVLLALGT